MIDVQRLSGRIARIGLLAALAGCVTLLPKDKPATLYRFGDSLGAAQDIPGKALVLRKAPTGFDRAAAGDRLLTVTGHQAAYVAGARWVSPASDLFDAALIRAFETAGAGTRLLTTAETARPNGVLAVNVEAFEARYDGGAAAPTVVVEISASLSGLPGGKATSVKHILVKVPASENRQGAIANAFDAAVNQAVSQILTWVKASA